MNLHNPSSLKAILPVLGCPRKLVIKWLVNGARGYNLSLYMGYIGIGVITYLITNHLITIFQRDIQVASHGHSMAVAPKGGLNRHPPCYVTTSRDSSQRRRTRRGPDTRGTVEGEGFGRGGLEGVEVCGWLFMVCFW